MVDGTASKAGTAFITMQPNNQQPSTKTVLPSSPHDRERVDRAGMEQRRAGGGLYVPRRVREAHRVDLRRGVVRDVRGVLLPSQLHRPGGPERVLRDHGLLWLVQLGA